MAAYKMKGSPMYRNYGIGSPAKNQDKSFADKVGQAGEDIKQGIGNMMPWNQTGPKDSPTKHQKYSKAKGDRNDHGPELKHNDSAEAHNVKRNTKKPKAPGKAAYGNKDQGGGVQTYEEYTDEINAKKTSALPTKGHGYDDIKHIHKVRPKEYKGKNNSTDKGKKTNKKKKIKIKKPDFPPIGVEVVI